MILLLGGTSETAPIAEAVAAAGYRVLVSTATGIPLFVGAHLHITHRRGRLTEAEMASLVRKHRIRAIVDVTHPYASEVRRTSPRVAEQMRIPYLTYIRPGAVTGEDGVQVVTSHEQAAQVACESGAPVLVTVGSKNLRVYAEQARGIGMSPGVRMVARVLEHPDSRRAAREAGVADHDVVTGRGPFSIEENRDLIRRFGARTLVTKDSGQAGGVREKLEAARMEGCRVIVVAMPESLASGGFDSATELIRELERLVPKTNDFVIALDLESVLVPEIWETVARAAGVPELALTTRDVPDYDLLMRRRIQLCQQHGLTLARLRQIVASIEPLPGALEFLSWSQAYALVVIVSDTFYELAGPVVLKLGCQLITCNWLLVNNDGYVSGYNLCHEHGKFDSVTHFQRLGFRVLAVGDSYNDLGMLEAADAGFLFRPSERLITDRPDLYAVWDFARLETELRKASAGEL
ncbi:MAG TPA: bifunctional phosphoserine phosphatase/homoserine phosphotransferase ThrH [Terriglobales bacterium]|nr:bifunctional phosphoserine phosphatase/homoserine phosphotransferase ThrH [Terriglobales bacterium]